MAMTNDNDNSPALPSAQMESSGDGAARTTFGLTGRIVNGTKAALRQFPHQVISISRR